jgi:hypothetical protein
MDLRTIHSNIESQNYTHIQVGCVSFCFLPVLVSALHLSPCVSLNHESVGVKRVLAIVSLISDSACRTQTCHMPQEFVDDVNLIWANAKLYNPPSTDPYLMAVELEKEFGKVRHAFCIYSATLRCID